MLVVAHLLLPVCEPLPLKMLTSDPSVPGGSHGSDLRRVCQDEYKRSTLQATAMLPILSIATLPIHREHILLTVKQLLKPTRSEAGYGGTDTLVTFCIFPSRAKSICKGG